jgi:beta-aspartyl-peptidase (threonine type)
MSVVVIGLQSVGMSVRWIVAPKRARLVTAGDTLVENCRRQAHPTENRYSRRISNDGNAQIASQNQPKSLLEPDKKMQKRASAIAVHGGAGTIRRADLTSEDEVDYRAVITRALQVGHRILASGGPSLDAVCAAVQVFEDDPLFNAGKGSVFTNDGKIELDAAVMDGKTGKAGAVAGVRTIRNPVIAARAVMENTSHVLLSGAGAERFAALHGIDIVDPEYFHTEHRWDQLHAAQKHAAIQLDHDGATRKSCIPTEPWQTDNKFGTVGAVALDSLGNLAAATSTGGLTNKLYGRIGDSPIIGAGTYADNATAAVSGTGIGEFFMRGLIAYDVAARMKYLGLSLSDAVDQVIRCELDQRGGQGGVIALDAHGNMKFGFNTEGMYRGYMKDDSAPVVLIYRDG